MTNEVIFPELVSKVEDLSSAATTGGLRYSPDIVDLWFWKAQEIVETGGQIARFLFDEGDVLTEGWYFIRFSGREAKDYIAAVEDYLFNPGKHKTFAEALGEELESLTCGWEIGRYEAIEVPFARRVQYWKKDVGSPLPRAIINAILES